MFMDPNDFSQSEGEGEVSVIHRRLKWPFNVWSVTIWPGNASSIVQTESSTDKMALVANIEEGMMARAGARRDKLKQFLQLMDEALETL